MYGIGYTGHEIAEKTNKGWRCYLNMSNKWKLQPCLGWRAKEKGWILLEPRGRVTCGGWNDGKPVLGHWSHEKVLSRIPQDGMKEGRETIWLQVLWHRKPENCSCKGHFPGGCWAGLGKGSECCWKHRGPAPTQYPRLTSMLLESLGWRQAKRKLRQR